MESNAALRFQTGGRHQTSPASLRGLLSMSEQDFVFKHITATNTPVFQGSSNSVSVCENLGVGFDKSSPACTFIFINLFVLNWVLHLSLVGNSSHLTWVQIQQLQEQRYPFLQCMRCFHASKQTYGCQCFRPFMCAQMSMHVIAHEGCKDNARDSAFKVGSGRKIPCHTGESNLPQQHAGPTLYQLS